MYFPAEGYKWSDLKRYNADLRDAQSDLSWGDVQKMLQASYHQLLDFIDLHDDAALYGGPPKCGNKHLPRCGDGGGGERRRTLGSAGSLKKKTIKYIHPPSPPFTPIRVVH